MHMHYRFDMARSGHATSSVGWLPSGAKLAPVARRESRCRCLCKQKSKMILKLEMSLSAIFFQAVDRSQYCVKMAAET